MIENNFVFGTRKNKRYGFFNTICYHLREEWEEERRLLFFQCGMILPAVLGTFLGLLLPSEAVRGLEEGWPLERLAGWIVLLALSIWICHVLSQGLEQGIKQMADMVRCRYERKCFCKMMDMDYDVMEQEQALSGNTWRVLRNGDDFEHAAVSLPEIVIDMLGMAAYGVLIIQKNIVLLVLISLSVLARTWLLKLARRKHKENHAALSGFAKECAYITRQSKESTAGKDIRIYGMADLFLQRYDAVLKGMDRIFHKIHLWYFLSGSVRALVSLGADLFSYLYLTYLVTRGELSLSAFVLYIGLAAGFSTYFNRLNQALMMLNPFCASVSYIREFLEIPDRWQAQKKMGAERLAQFTEGGVKLEFADVSFTYPGSEKPVLSHINLTVRPGEKLALLGLNGAGKTTLVKLVCGFYEPTEGEILFNGVPVRQFDREEYYGMISVLFQDSTLLPVSLDNNITGEEDGEIDRKRLDRAVSLSGFTGKYQGLPGQGAVRLVKEVNERAADFSGGERQKLIFARALYKKASLLILDEPTAALDPIAENELYQNFSQAAGGRTSIYISHRLSSTRFCDRIVLLEQGRIVEEGTHDSLMKRESRYAALYEIQSRYYREEIKRRKREEDMGDISAGEEEERSRAFDEARK